MVGAVRADPSPKSSSKPGTRCGRLQAAGVPKENPQVAKAIAYLLSRQQPFGGWMDPLQSFENFRTPFRETQMAMIALSAYFPQNGREQGLELADLSRSSPSDPVRAAGTTRRCVGRAARRP